ncbi:DUF3237 domain-containing protein [Tepidiforma sp.]|uniref:DUF3237 domain-containing protein n=1 Tax=Tepidiforma sp. TaxID=2682230 RepID=UPI002ADD3B1C|nr:DUF3237 domain-containing protein [Tepidiforma sp.]
MPLDQLPVEYLFTMTANVAPPTVIQGGPQGSRMIVSVPGGTFEGPKLKGTVVPHSGGDWVTLRPDGSMKLDVRLTLLTEDGAAILVTYTGIGARTAEGGTKVYSTPQFETGAEKYAWLNSVQAVGIGSTTPGGVTYEVYALRA